MTIDQIIEGQDCNKVMLDILNRIHSEGPVNSIDFEVLAYIKKYQPEVFKSYEARLISLMGLFYKASEPDSSIEEIYSIFAETIEKSSGIKFTPVQADAFNKIKEKKNFSFSAPTSTGKSFLFKELIKGANGDIIIVVPSRALISEYINTIIKLVDKDVLVLQFVEIVNLKNTKRKIYVITPERGSEIFRNLDKLNIELFLFDEAQLSEEGIRGMKFDSLVRRVDKLIPNAKKVFTHPFVDNPEAQLLKHGFNVDSGSELYKQNSVGKIYLSYEKDTYAHFSPFTPGKKRIPVNSDIVKEKLSQNGTVLIYISKSKIYDKRFMVEFSEYIAMCPKLNNPEASKYIDRLKDFIGASDIDKDKRSLLIDMMERGIVVHHGSMPLNARLIIEQFVNGGFSKICFATSTLIQGVNMPFDIVWINNFAFNGSLEQKTLSLKNLIGRAGRSTTTRGSFDYGYVIVEKKNVPTFSKRMMLTCSISTTSKLDEESENLNEDQRDIVDAIKSDTFNDDLQLTDNQVQRIKSADIDKDVLFILDNLLNDGQPITGEDYNTMPKERRDMIKLSFKNIYSAHLRRDDLLKGETDVLNASILILLWQIQGKSFAEILSLRYGYLSQIVKRRRIEKKVRQGELTQEEADLEISNLKIEYSPAATPLPDSMLKKSHGLYGYLPVTELEYDLLVYDTYDYIDKVISLSLKDPLSAVFLMYYEKTKDSRALQISNYVKYGTNDEKEIWLVRYGFSFDDIEWLIEYVDSIDEYEIVFKDSIKELDVDRLEIIERFNNTHALE